MKLAMFAAVTVIIAAPIAVRGEPAPSATTAPPKAPAARRVCTVVPTIGSRVNNTRRCRTAAEVEAEQQEARQVVERVQAFKPTMCAPPRPIC